MASLTKTKTIDKSNRVNLSLKASSRVNLEMYRHFVQGVHKVPYNASEIAEMTLTAWWDQDEGFQRFLKANKDQVDALRKEIDADDAKQAATAKPAPGSLPDADHAA